jgi:hypothetical protein
MTRLASSAALLAATLLLAIGCSDAGGPAADTKLNFNLATSGAASASTASGGPETFSDGTNTLVIEQVDLVLREVELRTGASGDDCGESMNHESCEKLELGPILLSLPLGTDSALRAFSVDVPAGSYTGVQFEIHPPSGSEDAAFIAANPSFENVSVHVAGTYNGVTFDFVSDLEAEQEIHFATPLVVTEGAATDLTLLVDLDTWFRDAAGIILDPATAAAGQLNENLVKENIRSALDAFEDHDCNGIDDDNGDGQHGDGQHGQHGDDDGPNHT